MLQKAIFVQKMMDFLLLGELCEISLKEFVLFYQSLIVMIAQAERARLVLNSERIL